MIWDKVWKPRKIELRVGRMLGQREDPSLPRIMGGGLTFHFDQGERRSKQASLRERVVWHGTEAFKTWRLRGGGLPLPPFSLSAFFPRLPYHNFVDCPSRIPSFAYIHSFCLSIRHHTPSPLQSLVFCNVRRRSSKCVSPSPPSSPLRPPSSPRPTVSMSSPSPRRARRSLPARPTRSSGSPAPKSTPVPSPSPS